MYNFSGITYRIWAVGGWCLFIGLIGVLYILFELLLHRKKPKIRTYIFVVICVAFGLGSAAFYYSRSVNPSISSYAGEFIDYHHDSRMTLRTYQYTFWNGDGLKQSYYLDISSKREIYPYEFVEGREYLIYYENTTRIIVRVEEIS